MNLADIRDELVNLEIVEPQLPVNAIVAAFDILKARDDLSEAESAIYYEVVLVLTIHGFGGKQLEAMAIFQGLTPPIVNQPLTIDAPMILPQEAQNVS